MSSLGSFVWGIADQLRGAYEPRPHGNVILPTTTSHRLDPM
ncbi:type I restriction-modification system subunit M N-terminal domain-containing protein [Paenibacillus sp. TRM 82003]|nr:type I restriction-modification system subunit M N-terminal domain-containing protein [Paenibacillus sp. TRM 82003]